MFTSKHIIFMEQLDEFTRRADEYIEATRLVSPGLLPEMYCVPQVAWHGDMFEAQVVAFEATTKRPIDWVLKLATADGIDDALKMMQEAIDKQTLKMKALPPSEVRDHVMKSMGLNPN